MFKLIWAWAAVAPALAVVAQYVPGALAAALALLTVWAAPGG